MTLFDTVLYYNFLGFSPYRQFMQNTITSVTLSQSLHHPYLLCLKNLDGGTKGTRYNSDNVWHLPGILLLGGGEYVVRRSMRPPSPWGVDHGARPN